MRSLMARLEKLERACQSTTSLSRKWHRIIGDTEAELDAKAAEVRASDAWRPGDSFIRRLIVYPAHREPAL